MLKLYLLTRTPYRYRSYCHHASQELSIDISSTVYDHHKYNLQAHLLSVDIGVLAVYITTAQDSMETQNEKRVGDAVNCSWSTNATHSVVTANGNQV
jgi:hypothetical protein